MNTWSLIIACGALTYLIRFIPTYFFDTDTTKKMNRSILVFLKYLGPSAIVSLLIVSLWPQVGLGQNAQNLPTFSALLVIVISRYFRLNIINSTIFGVLFYAFCIYITK